MRSEIEGKSQRGSPSRRCAQVLLATVVGLLSAATTSLVGVSNAGASPPPPFTKPGEIINVAGGGPVAIPDSGIPALYAHLSNPSSAAVDPSGDVFIADAGDNEVKEVTPDGEIYVVAGNGLAGKSGNGGPAVSAELDDPEGVAVDPSGDVFIADTGNNEVREIVAGIIYDFAGDGTAGYSGDGGAPASAELSAPYGVAADQYGDVAIADTDNDVVRLVYPQSNGGTERGPAASTGAPFGRLLPGWAPQTKRSPHLEGRTLRIETFAGGGTSYGDGGPATSGQLIVPTAVAFDPADNNLYIADTGNSAIRDVSFGNADISTAAYVPYPTGVAANAADDLFIAAPELNEVVFARAGSTSTVRLAGDVLAGDLGSGGPARNALLDYPSGVALDQYGDVFIADTSNGLVREIVAARAPVFVEDSPPLDMGEHQPYAAYFAASGVPEPTYSLSGAPSWLAISSSTGTVTASPIPNGVSTFTYSVVATNASGTATAGPFTVSLPHPYIYTQPALAVFSAPLGVASMPNGDTAITDAGYDRVDVINSHAQIVGKFGTGGSGAGDLDVPTGIAVDAAGDFYVADAGNSRIEEFSPLGTYLRAFGKAGSFDGEFNDPQGVAIGPLGTVYVADAGNNRVQVFSATGGYLTQFGTPGHGNGQFEAPQGLAFTSAGILLVADSGNNRIEGFLADGQYFAQFGTPGTALGEFNRPDGVAVGPTGDIFVTDRLGNRVEVFSSSGDPVAQFRHLQNASTSLEQPDGIAVSGAGVITVADRSLKNVYQFAEETVPTFVDDTPPLATAPSQPYTYDFRATSVPAATYSLSGAPSFLTIDPSSGIVSGTPPSGTASFSYSVVATSPVGSVTVGPFDVTVLVDGGFLDDFGGTYSNANGEFEGPGGSATAPDGDLFVCDRLDNRIEVFSPTGQFISEWGTPGTAAGDLSAPSGIAFTSSGDVWVVDYGNNRMEEFTESGGYLGQFGQPGSGTSQFDDPEGVAIDQTNGNIYVADTENNRVQEFTSGGTYVQQFTTTSEGALATPTGLAVTSAGELYVGNDNNGDLVGYNASGTQNATFAGAGSGPGQVYGFGGVALDPVGDIWVSDYPNNRIEEFSSTGTYLAQFGSGGSGPGQISDPGQLSISPSGIMSVSDFGNDRVDQFLEPPLPDVYVGQFGSSGSGNTQFDLPSDIVVGSSGDYYVVDHSNNRVQEFNSSDVYQGQFPTGASSGPVNIAFTSSGDAWVTEEGCNCVVQYTSSGAPTGTKFGSAGSGDGQFNSPRGLAIDPKTGNIYVADVYNGRVQEFSSTGTYLSQISTASYGAISAINLTVTPSGELLIADYGHGDVVGFSSSGVQNLLVGSEGSGPGQMVQPSGITVDANGNIYVSDNGNARIDEFSATGQYVTEFGSAGSGNGQLNGPSGLVINSAGILSVCDLENDRVEQFGPA